MTLNLHEIWGHVCTKVKATYYAKFKLIQASHSQIYVLGWFWPFWPLLTPNDLWPPPKTIGIIYFIWVVHMLSMRCLRVTLLEKQCFQGFDLLTSGDPKWPLILTKNNRGHLLNKGYLHVKYEIHWHYRSWDRVFTSKCHIHTYTHTHTHTHDITIA